MDKALAKASEIINAKANYIGGGMEGYAVLSLIDESGYPSASALTIAKSDGIHWLTFASSPDSNKAKRIAKCGRASVCIASPEYNITLVGSIEEVTDIDVKKDNWNVILNGQPHWSGYDDPNFFVMRFKTERYSIFIVDGEETLDAVGTLTNPVEWIANKQTVVPIVCYAGQANQAIDLYVKAFGAQVLEKLTYADMHPDDLGEKLKDEYKNYIGYSGVLIGDQIISICDDSDAAENPKEISGNAYLVDLLVHFDSDKALKAAYDLLVEGGTVTSPLVSQTYCSLACALIDKFGGRWQLMSGYEG